MATLQEYSSRCSGVNSPYSLTASPRVFSTVPLHTNSNANGVVLINPVSFLVRPSRSLQSICKDINFVIRFCRIGCGGGNHGCEGHFGKEVCCAAGRGGRGATRGADTQGGGGGGGGWGGGG